MSRLFISFTALFFFAQLTVWAQERPRYAPGAVIVKFTEQAVARDAFNPRVEAGRARTGLESFDQISAALGASGINQIGALAANKTLAAELGVTRSYELIIRPNADVEAAVSRLKGSPRVELAHPSYLYYLHKTPDDPQYSQQYGLPKIDAPSAWDITTGSSNVKIAILDSGVDIDHPDLDSKLTAGYDFVDINVNEWQSDGFTLISGEDYTTRDSNPDDFRGHGTQVAGVAAAETNNGDDIAGVCWTCSIIPVRACFDITLPNGNRDGACDFPDVADGIVYAADNGADVINMSIGTDQDNADIRSSIQYASGQGSILVASSGNQDASQVQYPARYPEVMAVGATNSNDQRASFSNYGDDLDFAAPGVNIVTTTKGGGYPSSPSGTSFAAPHVSGLIGLMLVENPQLTHVKARDLIRYVADKVGGYSYSYGRSDELGYGRINAFESVKNAARPNPATNLEITNTGNYNDYVRLDWDPSSSTDVQGYKIFRCLFDDIWSSCSGWQYILYEDVTQAVDPSLLIGDSQSAEIVKYYVKAVDASSYELDRSNIDSWYVNNPNSWLKGPADEPAQRIPEAFSLDGNAPNPFRVQSTIRFAIPEATRFAIPEATHVSLVAYDMQGRVVRRLVDEPMAAGFHRVRFEARGLASGVYVYRLRAGESFTDTRQMVLVR